MSNPLVITGGIKEIFEPGADPIPILRIREEAMTIDKKHDDRDVVVGFFKTFNEYNYLQICEPTMTHDDIQTEFDILFADQNENPPTTEDVPEESPEDIWKAELENMANITRVGDTFYYTVTKKHQTLDRVATIVGYSPQELAKLNNLILDKTELEQNTILKLPNHNFSRNNNVILLTPRDNDPEEDDAEFYKVCFSKKYFAIAESSSLFSCGVSYDKIPLSKVHLNFLRETFDEESEISAYEGYGYYDPEVYTDKNTYPDYIEFLPGRDENNNLIEACYLTFDPSALDSNETNPFVITLLFYDIPVDFEYKITRTEFIHTSLVLELKDSVYFTKQGDAACCSFLTEIKE